MKETISLNDKVDKLIDQYNFLLAENQKLKMQLELLKDENDSLKRNNQDMFLKIDSTLTLLDKKEIG
jgi:cell division protein ZapB